MRPGLKTPVDKEVARFHRNSTRERQKSYRHSMVSEILRECQYGGYRCLIRLRDLP